MVSPSSVYMLDELLENIVILYYCAVGATAWFLMFLFSQCNVLSLYKKQIYKA
jgi:hypothetical protein